MVEPAILHPPFMPFFTVYYCITWIGLLGAESLHLLGVGMEFDEGTVYIGFRKHTNTSTELDGASPMWAVSLSITELIIYPIMSRCT